jgi:hypothetical protein
MNTLELISIDNNVKIEDLYNGKTWIHGLNKENIVITIFIITISGSQLKYCLNSINNLDTNISVLVNVIMNISPTSKAYNTMIQRCTTDFFIQLDEDMELFANSIEIISSNLKNIKSSCYLHYYYLIDEYLGISNPPVIIGLKIYNFLIMKNYHIKNFDTIVSSVDQMWHRQINEDGYVSKKFSFPIGYHARKRSSFDILLRYCKITKSMLDPRLKSSSGDKLKILRSINSLNNFNNIYKSIVCHFVSLKYSLDTFKKNNEKLLEYLKVIPIKNLFMYNIPKNFVSIDKINNYDFSDASFSELFKIPLGENMCNVKNIYAICGIVNSLFENYQYSYEHYPYSIDEHLKSVLKINIVFLIDLEINKNIINEVLLNTENIDMNFVSVNYFNCLEQKHLELKQELKFYDLIIDTTEKNILEPDKKIINAKINQQSIANIDQIISIICTTERQK